MKNIVASAERSYSRWMARPTLSIKQGVSLENQKCIFLDWTVSTPETIFVFKAKRSLQDKSDAIRRFDACPMSCW